MHRNREERGAIETAVRTLHEHKAYDLVVLDLRRLSDATDYFVIASGSSDTHVRALAEAAGVVGGKVAVDAVPDLSFLGLHRDRLAHRERAVGADRDLAAEVEHPLGRARRARGEAKQQGKSEPPHRSTLTASRSSVSKNGIGAKPKRRATSRSGNDCRRVRYCLTAPL